MRESSTSRRTFLKLGGTAAVASCVESVLAEGQRHPGGEAGRQNSSANVVEVKADDLLRYVNPLQGTDSTPTYSRGNTLPIIAMPFGMAHWTLQSSSEDSWFFQPHDCRLQGIRCTHQLSPWLQDYGYATFQPFHGEVSAEPGARGSSYRPAELEISPHFLKMRLMKYCCWIELAPSERGAMMRFTFENSGASGIFIDLPGEDSEAQADLTSGVIKVLTRENKGGVQKNFAVYYVCRIDAPITACEVKKLKGRNVAVARFHAEQGRPVCLRVGTSFISYEQAAQNLAQEIGERSFENMQREAARSWEEKLGRVLIQGASDSQMRTFYSCLYRTQLFPRMWHETDPTGNVVHRSPYTGNVEPGVLYADHGFWDDYHAWYPMMVLLYPERLGEILQGWVNAYKEGGWFPQFPCPGYRGAMTGSLIDSLFADAVVKNVPGFDVQSAYMGLRKHATEKGDPGKGYGRVGIESYLKLGYLPCDQFGGGVAQTLDFAYGDFCIAQMARAVGNQDDAAMFSKRADNWKKLFDPQTKFLRGRLADGSWLEPFEPHTWGGAYVEGGPWQYRFNVLHDPEGLMDLFGGKSAFLASLEEMLTQAPGFHAGSYGQEIHEMSEMAAVDFGQYAHCNQPVHNVLYMFTAAGRRDRTQYWVHRALHELYTPDNFPGDEDTGAMAAWYVLSSLGVFALCPGKPEWSLGAPFFPSAEIHFPDGRNIHIEARRQHANAYYDRVTLNGRAHKGPSIAHSELLQKDVHLVFSAT